MKVINFSKQNIHNLLVCLLLVMLFTDNAEAQQGGQIFKDAACNLLDLVLTKNFGAMITSIAGFLALIGAAAGAFRGAWIVVFVSVGCFIYPELLNQLFPGMCQ